MGGRGPEKATTLAFGPIGNMANVLALVLLKDSTFCVWVH